MKKNPNQFPGHTLPFYGSDHTLGFDHFNILQGNTVNANSQVSVLRYHTIFINSDLGSHSDSIGPLSQSTIMRKVVVDQPFGQMINDFHGTLTDYVQLEKQSISSIRFRLTDWQGQPVTIEQGWSLSIILVPEEEF